MYEQNKSFQGGWNISLFKNISKRDTIEIFQFCLAKISHKQVQKIEMHQYIEGGLIVGVYKSQLSNLQSHLGAI